MGLWPSLVAFSADVSAGYETVRQWFKRQSIPVRYWPEVIAGAQRRQISGVTCELLMRLHAIASSEQAA